MQPDTFFSDMLLRKATPEDQALLEYWDTQPHVIAAAPHDTNEWEQSLKRQADWEVQLIAELAGRPIGFMYVIDPQLEVSKYWGEVGFGFRALDIWIGEAADLGKGYGTIMMIKVLDYCFAQVDVKAVWIDPLESNVDARRFYERLGFQFLERRRFEQDECIVYQMPRAHWETKRPILMKPYS